MRQLLDLIMGTPFTTRVVLKIKEMVRELDPAEKKFGRIWPRIDLIEGWLLNAEGKWLFKRALSLPDGANLVEIGSFKGRSTCCLAFGCRGTNKRVYAIDTFDGGPDLPRYDSFQEFCLNLKRCELSEYFEPVMGISWEFAKTWNKPIDFLFIDGSHIYEDVSADFASFLPHVVPGGIIAFHDVHENHPGVLKAWHETMRHQLADVGYCNTIGFGRKPEGKIPPSES
jgi:predicted O-methyltransferase YrrM